MRDCLSALRLRRTVPEPAQVHHRAYSAGSPGALSVVPTKHYVNLNYVCNEHCVFCASNLTNNLKGTGVRRELTLEQIRAWIEEHRPRRDDEVLLAGGEPTLHKDLFAIVREFAEQCRDIKLFTNALKLADESYARAAIAAGVSGFEIALFGATPATHDAITRR